MKTGDTAMFHFRNDYSTGAHPAVWEALCRTNGERTEGYGLDPLCRQAEEEILSLCQAPGAAVRFLVGGTQANKVAIGAFLRPYEAVLAAASAHICCHETGAVEHNGHKVIHLPTPDGKLTGDMVRAAAAAHTGEYTVAPRLVYISNTTEVGTVYRRAELAELRRACDALDLLLYCDGARLGSAMAAGDASFADYGALCDAFTVGGTKNGLLFGEALVIANPALQPCFRHCMKQQGAILAKGRLLGVQFEAFLEDGLFLDIGKKEVSQALRLRRAFEEKGYPLFVNSPTNQQFPVLPDGHMAALEKNYSFEVWEKTDEGHTAVRFCTSWSTADEDVDALIADIQKL